MITFRNRKRQHYTVKRACPFGVKWWVEVDNPRHYWTEFKRMMRTPLILKPD